MSHSPGPNGTTIVHLNCQRCRAAIDVVFDPKYPRDNDKGLGDYILAGHSCWNCGVDYTKMFNTQVDKNPQRATAPYILRGT